MSNCDGHRVLGNPGYESSAGGSSRIVVLDTDVMEEEENPDVDVKDQTHDNGSGCIGVRVGDGNPERNHRNNNPDNGVHRLDVRKQAFLQGSGK